MELPLDAQSSGRRLDVDERVEQCRAVVGVLHVLARFVLVLQMQHLRGIHMYREEPPRTDVIPGLQRREVEGYSFCLFFLLFGCRALGI
jgi:hypothetical protein